jgi:IS5 family transposase
MRTLEKRQYREADLLAGDGSKGGRPPFDPVSMFKALILQAQHSLSDAKMEFMIRNRLSWMRFPGFALSDPTPVSGYKSDISINRRFGFIRTGTVTSAASADGRQLKHVVSTDITGSNVWADSACRSKKNEKWLADKMLNSQIHRRKPVGRPMPAKRARQSLKNKGWCGCPAPGLSFSPPARRSGKVCLQV